MIVWIRADWLQDGDIEVKDFPQDVCLDPDHPYVSTSGGNVIIDQMFDACMKVRDVYRYKIEKHGNLVVRRLHQDKDVREECDLPKIILLLESPHRDEYCNNRPCAPAMGQTGRNLDRQTGDNCGSGLSCVLSQTQIRNSIRDGSSRIIISNPIQFQASLHMILQGKMNRDVRNAVWNSLWQHQDRRIQNCFAARMEIYDPYIIINACTKGYNRKGELLEENKLQKKVTAFLKTFLEESGICCEVYEINHPSSWFSREYPYQWTEPILHLVFP